MAIKIVVIGAGPGGYTAAIRAAQLGADVTLIERDKVGGTCLNRGCIPSKIMVKTAALIDRLRRAAEFGILINGHFSTDMEKLMARKDSIVSSQVGGIEKLLQSHKIKTIGGNGYLISPGLVGVKLPDGQDLQIAWDKLILALGTEPLGLPVLPFDGQRIISSNEALCLRHIPPKMIIVGGGVIGCELAFIFSSLGSRVTLVEAMPRLLPLPSIDENISKVLQREMKKRKLNFYVNRVVEKAEMSGDKLLATLGPAPTATDLPENDKKSLTVEADMILVCVGRRPLTAGVGLEKIGVQTEMKGWILANKKMETNVKDVYAIGDILGPAKIMLAHVASAEGMIAAENAMGARKLMCYHTIPIAIFTVPEIAAVGLTEFQAKTSGRNYRSSTVLYRSLGKAHCLGEIAGEAKIISEADTGKILGVHIVGAHATELIAEATLAIETGCLLRDLAETIHAHPTLSEIIKETALKSLDRPLHG